MNQVLQMFVRKTIHIAEQFDPQCVDVVLRCRLKVCDVDFVIRRGTHLGQRDLKATVITLDAALGFDVAALRTG